LDSFDDDVRPITFRAQTICIFVVSFEYTITIGALSFKLEVNTL